MIFTATLFSCGNNDRGDGTGHMYDVSVLGNPQSLDPQYAVDSASNTIIKNLYSGLMTSDTNGNILCCNAESYSISSDEKTITGFLTKMMTTLLTTTNIFLSLQMTMFLLSGEF